MKLINQSSGFNLRLFQRAKARNAATSRTIKTTIASLERWVPLSPSMALTLTKAAWLLGRTTSGSPSSEVIGMATTRARVTTQPCHVAGLQPKPNAFGANHALSPSSLIASPRTDHGTRLYALAENFASWT